MKYQISWYIITKDRQTSAETLYMRQSLSFLFSFKHDCGLMRQNGLETSDHLLTFPTTVPLVTHVCDMTVSPNTVNVLDGVADFTSHFFLIALHLCDRDV